MIVVFNQLKKGDSFIFEDNIWKVIECVKYFKAISKDGKKELSDVSIHNHKFEVELI